VIVRKRISNLNEPLAYGIAFFAFLCALTLSYLQGIETTRYPDAPLFIEQASGILKGWESMKLNSLIFLSPLGFTSTLALSFFLSQSSSLILFKIILAIIHGLSTFLVASIGKSIGMPKKFWFLAAFCFSLDPFILISALDIQVETLVTFLVLWWGYLLILKPKSYFQQNLQAIGFGVSGFFAVSIRPNILIPFSLLALMMFYSWRSKPFGKILITKSLLSFFSPLIIFEILISKLYGGFVFLAANGGLNTVLTCREQFLSQYTGLISRATNVEINQTYYAQLQQIKESILLQNPGISFSDLNREYLSLGVETCFQDPGKSAVVLVVKSIALWRPFTVIGAYGITISLLSLLIWLPLSFATIWFLVRKHSNRNASEVSKYFLILAIGFTVSLIPSSTQIRHRVAFVEPYYWLFGVYALFILLPKIRKARD